MSSKGDNISIIYKGNPYNGSTIEEAMEQINPSPSIIYSYSIEDFNNEIITITFNDNYNFPVNLLPGRAYKLTSDKGITIKGDGTNRCITANGCFYLELNNIILSDGIGGFTSSTPDTKYIPDSLFKNINQNGYSNWSPLYNGGGCSILGNTIIKLNDISINNCTAKGCGGGLYIDPVYPISYNKGTDSYLKESLYPPALFLIYKGEFYTPSLTELYKYEIDDTNYIKLDGSNWEITIKGVKGDNIGVKDDTFPYIPKPDPSSKDLYINGYTFINNLLFSINEISKNNRGYNLYWINSTCNYSSINNIKSCSSNQDGGGVYINNISYYFDGGNENNSLNISSCKANGYGGGMCIMNTIDSMYNNKNLIENGVFLNKSNINMIIQNINFESNTTSIYGGGLYYGDNYNGLLENCKFNSNTAYCSGGGLFIMGNQFSTNKGLNNNSFTNYLYFNPDEDDEYIKYQNEPNNKHIYTSSTNSNYTISYENGQWIAKGGDNTFTNNNNLNVFNKKYNIPNISGWNVVSKRCIPTIRFYLDINLNTCSFTNNNVILDNDIYNNSFQHLNSIFPNSCNDYPLNIGGGLSIFSCTNISLDSPVINSNEVKGGYGGGIAIFNNILSLNLISADISENKSSGKGKDIILIGNNKFISNLSNSDNTISETELINNIFNSTNIFYSDIVYINLIAQEKKINDCTVEYYDNISDVVNNIKGNLSKKSENSNYIYVYKDYYSESEYKSFKLLGSEYNNIYIQMSLSKDFLPTTIFNNINLDISDFNTFQIKRINIINSNNPNTINKNNKLSILKASGGAIILDNVILIDIIDCNFYNCSSLYGGAISFFKKNSNSSSVKCSNSIFNNCKSSNLGGAIFNCIYDDNDDIITNKLFNPDNTVNIQDISILECNFNNCSATNRGGAIYCFYNTYINYSTDTTFNGNKADVYGNDIFVSDQSEFKGIGTDNVFLEGSTYTSYEKSAVKAGLVYIDNMKNNVPITDIFTCNDGKYTKGLDLYFSNIEKGNISSTIQNEDILYQLYDYDYLLNNTIKFIKGSDSKIQVNIIDGNLNKGVGMLFRSRELYDETNNYVYTIFDESEKDIIEKGGFLFNDITKLKISGISCSNNSLDGISLFDLNNVVDFELTNFKADNNKGSSVNGVVISINDNKLTSNSSINIHSDISLINNITTSGNGGFMYGLYTNDVSFIIGQKGINSNLTTLIKGNKAIKGGAFCIEGGGLSTIQSTTTNLSNNQITLNEAQYGGAFYFNNIKAEIDNMNINNNISNNGGAIYLDNNANLSLQNVEINNNGIISNCLKSDSYLYKNGSFGGGIYMSGSSNLNIQSEVKIQNNNAYWGGGIFKDYSGSNNITIDGSIQNTDISNNNYYDIYIVGNGSNDITDYNNFNSVLNTIDVDIIFDDDTKGRYLVYPIFNDDGHPIPYKAHNTSMLDYLFNTYIKSDISKYKTTKSSSGCTPYYENTVKSININIYNENFTYNTDADYNVAITDNNLLENIIINGGSNNTKFNGGNNEITFSFSGLTDKLNITNLIFNDINVKSKSLYTISNCKEFTYNANTHNNVKGSFTTNYTINDVITTNIKSNHNNCIYTASNNITNNNRTKGGFLNITNKESSNTLDFTGSLNNIGSLQNGGNNLPLGGIFYIDNTSTIITGDDITGIDNNICYEGGFIYNIVNSNTTFDISGINELNSFNALNKGGAISLVGSDNSLTLEIKGINITNCTSENYGGGISSINCNLNMENVSIKGCSAKSGGGLYTSYDGTNSIGLTLNEVSIENNMVKGNIMNNLDGINLKNNPEGFGGGIFTNGVDKINFNNVKGFNNSSIILFPNNGDYEYTYGSQDGYTDVSPSISNDIITITEQQKLNQNNSWGNTNIPSGGFMFMMNGITLQSNSFTSTKSNINNNTPDDVFPSIINVDSNLSYNTDISTTFNKLGQNTPNIKLWSLLNGSKGGDTTYSSKKEEGYENIKGGLGSIVESLQDIDIGNDDIIYFNCDNNTKSETNQYGKGGIGGTIYYIGSNVSIISQLGSSKQFIIS